MSAYTIYSTNDGEILRQVQCAPSQIDAQLQESEAFVQGAYDDTKFVIIDGQAVEVELSTALPTAAETRRALTQRVQKLLNDGARSRGYDDIVSACSYAGAPNPFQQESIDFLTWRSGVWTHCYQALADVEAGIRPVPTEEELLAELPQLVFTTNQE